MKNIVKKVGIQRKKKHLHLQYIFVLVKSYAALLKSC